MKPFDEVKDKIRKDIEQQRLQDTTGKWKQQVVNDLLKDADIKVNNKEFKDTFKFLEKKNNIIRKGNSYRVPFLISV